MTDGFSKLGKLIEFRKVKIFSVKEYVLTKRVTAIGMIALAIGGG
jgi:hypothetical protein